MADATNNILMYATNWCPQSVLVENFLREAGIMVEVIDIDQDEQHRRELVALNDGYASVPTLVFADGTKLVEPTLAELRLKLGQSSAPDLLKRVRDRLRRRDKPANGE